MAAGLTKTQLTRHLAEKIGTNNKTAAAFLEHLADTAIKETKKNGVFVVPGLGRLVKAHRKARMGRNPQTGEVASRVRTPEEYITRSAPLLEQNGFFEREISRRTEKFGNIAHLFSTYESRHKAEDEKPFARGINSIQLMNDGKRWWVVTILWQGEDEKTPLPAEYLRTRN